jgi:hypothetical protein
MTASFSDERKPRNFVIGTILVNESFGVRPKWGVEGGGFSHRKPPASRG